MAIGKLVRVCACLGGFSFCYGQEWLLHLKVHNVSLQERDEAVKLTHFGRRHQDEQVHQILSEGSGKDHLGAAAVSRRNIVSHDVI